tara:strand:+ start:1549 stop:1914 length:366 start_codon:yes stop_codon:yes gene_type:complete
MHTYVNHQAMREVFEPSQAETNPMVRAVILRKVMDEFSSLVVYGYSRTAFELKKDEWSVGQISELLNISGRKVKRMISDHASIINEPNPLLKNKTLGYIDISHIVAKAKAADKASQPVSAE